MTNKQKEISLAMKNNLPIVVKATALVLTVKPPLYVAFNKAVYENLKKQIKEKHD